jgi:hypothetical protein
MPCTPSASSASRSAWRWASLPLTLAALPLLIALRLSLVLYGLALRRRTPAASTPAPEPLPAVMTPEDTQEALPGPHDADLTSECVTDLWLDYLDDDLVQTNCVHHLSRCYQLDPAKHEHP